MQFKRLRKVTSKRLKARRKQVELLSEATEQSIERNVFKRFSRLVAVRRFVIGWVILMVLMIGALVGQLQHLSAYYQTEKPVDGGIFREGLVGSISNVSPIYASRDADRSLSRLMFAGLLGYDQNGDLQPLLAKDFAISDNGRRYTVHLKSQLRWHDGKPLTSADVLFTFNTIKNPDARSPLFSTWKDIVVAAPDSTTITFQLPSTLASFEYNLTTGIIPKHLLGKVSATAMRSSEFNTIKPIGAGPFMLRGLEVKGGTPEKTEEQVALVPFEHYAAGTPKLSEFVMRLFGSQQALEDSFSDGQLNAVAGLNVLPENAPKNAEQHSLLLKAGTYVFFKNSNPVLSSVKVRQALVSASNPTSITNSLDYMTRPVVGPLLSGQLAFDKTNVQQTGNVDKAKQLLAEDGWQMGTNGIAAKDGIALSFGIVIVDTPEYKKVAAMLKDQWRQIGARVDVQSLPVADYSSALAGHDYDATLHGISIGEDPDVYAYWHSSQADIRSTNRLNLSEWNNATADQALEAGRTRTEDQTRVVKYAPFLQAWQQESPALGLYQPRSLYITRGPLYGLTTQTITTNIDRYNGVENWQIRSAQVTDSD